MKHIFWCVKVKPKISEEEKEALERSKELSDIATE